MRWQDFSAGPVQDTTYGPQLPPDQIAPRLRPGVVPQLPGSPWSVQPTSFDLPGIAPQPQFQRQRQPIPLKQPSLTTLTNMGLRPPQTPQQLQWVQQNMPAQLPTTPLAGSGTGDIDRYDPSQVAQMKAMQDAMRAKYNQALGTSPMPPQYPSAPLVPGMTLNSAPMGGY